jgi:hypothetical protein
MADKIPYEEKKKPHLVQTPEGKYEYRMIGPSDFVNREGSDVHIGLSRPASSPSLKGQQAAVASSRAMGGGSVSSLFGNWANNVHAEVSIDNMNRIMRNLEMVKAYEKQAASVKGKEQKDLLKQQAINLAKETVSETERELPPQSRARAATQEAKQTLREAEDEHNTPNLDDIQESPETQEDTQVHEGQYPNITINMPEEKKESTLGKLVKMGGIGLSGFLASQALKNNKERIEAGRRGEEKLHEALEDVKKRYELNPQDDLVKKEYETALMKENLKMRKKGNALMNQMIDQHMRRKNALPLNLPQTALNIIQGEPSQENFNVGAENEYGQLMRMLRRLPG